MTAALQWSVAITADLCWYRVTEEVVLPYVIRHLIKSYAFVIFTNDTLRETVRFWCDDRETVLQRYGDINDWDERIAGDQHVQSLFQQKSVQHCNRIGGMRQLCDLAIAFHQPFDTWNVRNVGNMKHLFTNTKTFNQSLAVWDVRDGIKMLGLFTIATTFNGSLTNWQRHKYELE